MKRTRLKQSRPQPRERLCRRIVQAELGPLCLFRCGRPGCEAHHVLPRSLWPAPMIKYEPDFQVWLCHQCHAEVEADSDAGYSRILHALAVVDDRRFLALLNYRSQVMLGIDFAPMTVKDQTAYLRWRLGQAKHNWTDQEVDMAPTGAWEGV